MKQSILFLLILSFSSSCNLLESNDSTNQGILTLIPSVNQNQNPVPLKNARITEDSYLFTIDIFNEDDLENSIRSLDTESLSEELILPEGNYIAKAYTNEYSLPSFSDSIYSGQSESFSISANEETEVSINCTLENVKVSISYIQNTLDFFDDIYTVVSTNSGSLLFSPNDEMTYSGFFESGNFNFDVRMQKDGINYQSLFSYENAQPSDWLKISFNFSGELTADGIGNINLIIDDSQNGIDLDWELDPVELENYALYISEYAEGSGYNKAIEIYNPTAESIDLANYSIVFYANGATESSSTLDLSGEIEAYSTYLIIHSSFDQDLLPENITQNLEASISITGNDAFVLSHQEEAIDQFGVIGDDADFASNITLRRKAEVGEGNLIFSMEEWDEFEEDNFENLGTR
ncbi:DUF4493 domain-containing protein [Sediminitomix flava]|uniref:Lamin tail-like protein n=1 Tax=Sediminitomix flava TaxID=379075 RepID=A0A315ZGM4_SEDFL|nr:DUF4493 domain-containing protein [Sediminitomix flava]PWJ44492.1 lamin tail-like protein [Sediminitomix flava]